MFPTPTQHFRLYLNSNRQQTLLEEDQPRSAGNATIAHDLLKHNWNLAAQHSLRPLGDFVLYRSDQCRSGCGDVASEDENLRIENVHEAYYGGCQVLQGAINYITRAFVSFSGSSENGFSVRELSSGIHRELGRGGSVQMAP